MRIGGSIAADGRDERIRLLALVGPPGSGKGTQAAWLSSALGLTSLSTGDLARAAAREPTNRGRGFQRVLDSGGLLPNAIVDELVVDAIAGVPASSRGLLFDGYPRSDGQAHRLEDEILTRPLDAYVELRVADDVLLQRLTARGRHDDHELAVLRRLDEYRQRTVPMLQRLRREDRVLTVDGAQPPAIVHRAIVEGLGRRARMRRASFVGHG
jgi:adenylate kinase